MDRSKQLIRDSQAKSTVQAYDQWWWCFASFCAKWDVDEWYPSVEVVVAFVADLHDKSIVTLTNQAVGAIGRTLRDCGLEDPTTNLQNCSNI